jgi:hypothetical protein
MFVRLESIKCTMGYGQRGLNYEYGIKWPRDCLTTTYCWEVTTTDIELMKLMFDFPWDPYYKLFYLTGCGGEWGSPHHDPYILVDGKVLPNGRFIGPVMMPKNLRRFVTLNITVPETVTNPGVNEVNMPMTYSCSSDYCASAPPGAARTFSVALIAVVVVAATAASTMMA